MIKNLAILGAGGHGRVIADAAISTGCWEHIVFYDGVAHTMLDSADISYGGTVAEYFNQPSQYYGVIVGIGNNSVRSQLINTLLKLDVNIASVVHSKAIVSTFARIGRGVLVSAGAIVNVGSVVDDGAIINTGAVVDHDCTIGFCSHICPGTSLAGGVSTGELSWVGVGASVKENIRIGDRALVGAGAVVVSDIPSDITAVGIPAKSV